jgi:hypothetical protein
MPDDEDAPGDLLRADGFVDRLIEQRGSGKLLRERTRSHGERAE